MDRSVFQEYLGSTTIKKKSKHRTTEMIPDPFVGGFLVVNGKRQGNLWEILWTDGFIPFCGFLSTRGGERGNSWTPPGGAQQLAHFFETGRARGKHLILDVVGIVVGVTSTGCSAEKEMSAAICLNDRNLSTFLLIQPVVKDCR
ncbi:hypothetical protein TNCT_236271 [Trichonephila clavata]|uniref:Uncharacterized protein n=1 Tax=Trichonephila clavata TaxID=2740835 RepID=A0A8X6GJ86_TRICU|nr:hypothetical protein TNCT_236271 [Trichonephila clavata]